MSEGGQNMNSMLSKQMPPFFPPFFERQEIPPRVRAAMSFLFDMGSRSMPRAAVNDMSIEVLNPPDLSIPEIDARNSAAHLLSDYFEGTLQPSIWENEKEAAKSPTGLPGLYTRCPFCTRANKPLPDCPCCKGSGEVMIFPIPKMEESE